MTVDSGACDSIVPPHLFPNTKTQKHNEVGRTYGACGGETVTNVGLKKVNCVLGDGTVKSLDFQVGDKVTRGLLAVSQLACSGAGVWFGPGPEYESYIIWDKKAKVVSDKYKQPVKLINGTYQMDIIDASSANQSCVQRHIAGCANAAADAPASDDDAARFPQSAEASGRASPVSTPGPAGSETPVPPLGTETPHAVDVPGQLGDRDLENQLPGGPEDLSLIHI